MVSEDEKQHIIVRQNVLNRAVDILIDEQNRTKSEAKIPTETITNLATELEAWVFQSVSSIERELNPTTGKVQEKKEPAIEVD